MKVSRLKESSGCFVFKESGLASYSNSKFGCKTGGVSIGQEARNMLSPHLAEVCFVGLEGRAQLNTFKPQPKKELLVSFSIEGWDHPKF